MKDIFSYVRKKYFSWQNGKEQEVLKENKKVISEKRMLFSLPEELYEIVNSESCSYTMYERLIDRWMEQIISTHPEEEPDLLKKTFYGFAQLIAVRMYRKYCVGKQASLSKEKLQAMAIAYETRFEILTWGKDPLLSKKETGEYEFLHNSLLEYFLAQEAYQNLELLEEFSFVDMPYGKKFLQEIILRRDMVRVNGGRFLEKNQKDQIIIDPFYIDKYPLQVKKYRAYCKAKQLEMPPQPSWGWEEDAPVIHIKWQEAVDFCTWFGARTGLDIRLPREVEWEFAARTGNYSRNFLYAGGNDIDEVAWYNKNSDRKTQVVGSKKPNGLGLYDMSGNVWEWCMDIFTHSANNTSEHTSTNRSIRGGSWLNHSSSCKLGIRGFGVSDNKSSIIGFRLFASAHHYDMNLSD